ncbi:MAG: TauD/TfdA family dioxygenase [Gammaproteobacteria bacterium]
MQFYPPSHYDDDANGFTEIETVPLAAAMGAEIRGVDIANISDAQFEQIRVALFHYKMIYFRDQDLTIEDQENFTLRFGPFGTDAYTGGMEGHPNVQRVVKEADTVVKRVFGETWHTDSPFLPNPPAISLLYAVEVPPYGGDTWWSNTQLAYEWLSNTMKALLAGLKVHMSARDVLLSREDSARAENRAVGDIKLTVDQQKNIEGNYHPIIRTHPHTGNKALYVDTAYSLGIEGMKNEEAEAILGFLRKHVTQEIFTCRLRWENGTFVLWDNRACLHYAFNDYDGYRREMLRTIVDGERPA